MFQLESSGLLRRKFRLIAHEKLSPADFAEICRLMHRRPMRARKIGLVAARQARSLQRIETRWNGKETSAVAQAGDWIVTTLTQSAEVMRDREGEANTYVIGGETFSRLYQRLEGSNDFGDLYRSGNVVQAARLEAGFDILAPWDERQVAPSGYLVLNGAEVYGNNRETFEVAYEILG